MLCEVTRSQYCQTCFCRHVLDMATNNTSYVVLDVFYENGTTAASDTTAYHNETDSVCCDGSESYNYRQIRHHLWTYGTTLLIIIGTCGNTISGAVVLRKKQRHHASSVYILALAIADTTLLLVGSFIFPAWVNFDITIYSHTACKFQRLIMFWMINNTSWILMSISIERMVAVWWPLRVRTLFTRKVARIQVTVLVFASFLVNIHIPWTFAIVRSEGGLHCIVTDKFRRMTWEWINKIITPVIPFLTMVTCSVLIVFKIIKSKIRRSAGRSRKIPRITFSLLLVCLFYIICGMPISVTLIQMDRLVTLYGCCYTINIILPSAMLLILSNSSLNLFLYCLRGSKFRAELRDMFWSVINKCTGCVVLDEEHFEKNSWRNTRI